MERTNRNREKFFTQKDKILFKLFLLVFAGFVVILNWADVSWFLNIRTAPEMIRGSFERMLSQDFFVGEEDGKEEKTEEVKEEIYDYCGENSIVIPAIDIEAPIVEAGGVTEEEYRSALDRGVLHFPDSPYPGEEGLAVLLGHSAPEGWPKIKYDWVFTEINDLKEGDEIEICFNDRLYNYTVVDDKEGKRIYDVGEDIPSLYEKEKEIVLMSCWPPGERESRIGIRGVIE